MKYLKILYIIPISILVTLMYWGFGYIWFDASSVTEERVGAAILMLVASAFTALAIGLLTTDDYEL